MVRVITDNGANYKAAAFYRTVTAVARHQRIRAYLTNEAERAAAITIWNIHCNYHRPHTAVGDQPPASRLHTGVTNVMTQNI